MLWWLQGGLIVLLIMLTVAVFVAAVRDRRPLRRLCNSAVQGGLALTALNLAAGFTGVSVGFSWLAIGGSCLLGIPGVIALVLLQIVIPIG